MLSRLVPAFLLLIPALSAQPCAPDSTSEFPGSIQDIGHDLIRFSLNTGHTFDVSPAPLFNHAVRACRLAHDRFLISGEGGAWVLPSLLIVDVRAGRLLDSFYASEPALSPDRRWLAFRRFTPLYTDSVPSDQYMFYDLSKSSEKQRTFDVLGGDAPGQPVYPIEKPFFIQGYDDMPPEERHTADSSIHWSSDSRLFLFSESTVAGKNVVVVKFIDGKPVTYVNTNSSAASCLSWSRQTGIADVRLVTGSAPNWQISITSSAKGCAESPLIISSDGLRPAPIQKHKPLSPPAPTIRTERPIP